jgi:signal transduction histidine kinase
MIHRFLNWRFLFLLLAVSIVTGTVVYTRYLAGKMVEEERQRVEEWVLANKVLQESQDIPAISLANMVIVNNEEMPLMAVDDTGRVVDHRNLDSQRVASDRNYLPNLLDELKDANPPIDWIIADSPRVVYQVYYGMTRLQRQVQYYPLIQLLIVALFIVMLVALLHNRYQSAQNLVWAGMAKETAHQMGTPITSLRGWTELLKESGQQPDIVRELEKDVDRLMLVSDRFGKIGSQPQLELVHIGPLVESMVQYMKRRAPDRVQFIIQNNEEDMQVMASPTLINWVLENLIKNALDAIEGMGSITLTLTQTPSHLHIDVKDSGKGIAAANVGRVFSPGFTTKKRGWGLGLTLSKRIMEQYHGGALLVKHSEPGKGTTFRMSLPR